jgi:hypothetical protein
VEEPVPAGMLITDKLSTRALNSDELSQQQLNRSRLLTMTRHSQDVMAHIREGGSQIDVHHVSVSRKEKVECATLFALNERD